jgi:putative oxidoreductase
METDAAFLTSPKRLTKERLAAIAETTARVIVGLIFSASGLSGFLFLFMSAPPAPAGLAGVFQDVFFRSHWVQVVDLFELVAGVLLLANRYVTFAMTLLAAILVNILTFHISMQPETLPAPLIVLALWLVLAYRRRADLAPLFKK